MFKTMRYRRSILVCSGIIVGILLLVRCIDHEPKIPKPVAKVSFEQFAGSEACASCHKAIYATHIHTSHYLTTRPALEQYIKGNFEPGKNRYAYDSQTVVVMEKGDSGFYQVGYYKGVEGIKKRFDIVVGSGAKGQTYITRFQNRLYQLPFLISLGQTNGQTALSILRIPYFLTDPLHPGAWNAILPLRKKYRRQATCRKISILK
jgi:hypothetical protein